MKFSLIYLAFISFLATSPVVRAAVIVQTTLLSTAINVIPDAGIEHYPAIAAYRFDPSLGTLNSVGFEYRGAISTSITGGYDNYPPPPSGSYAGTVSVTLSGIYPSVSATAYEPARGVVTGASFSVTSLLPAHFDVSGTLDPSGFTAAASPDTLVADLVEAPVGRIGNFNLSNASCNCTMPFYGSYGTETINTDAAFTLTYDYTPIPEPASWAVFCFALAGLWSTRKLPAQP